MQQILIAGLTILLFSVLAKPGYADQFIENAIRECVKYEFDKNKDKYTTVTEVQSAHKSITKSCTYSLNSACKDHNNPSCVSSLNRYRSKEPERRSYKRYKSYKKNEQITVIHDSESKK